MVNDAYIEHNKTKRQAWLVIPLALLVIALIVLFGNHDESNLPQLKILDSSPQGMLLQLPIVSTTDEVSWQAQWAPASSTARQQVFDSLSQYAADFKQLRPQLEIWTESGSAAREKVAQRIGEALAHYHLGRAVPATSQITAPGIADNGAILVCTEADRELALRMLAALTPYLGGNVSVHFDAKLIAQSMRLYLLGTPSFNDQGQATFDPVAAK
ncbi:MAG: hypothetical protein WCY88_03780 [Spongiibacteraceae bacterium]